MLPLLVQWNSKLREVELDMQQWSAASGLPEVCLLLPLLYYSSGENSLSFRWEMLVLIYMEDSVMWLHTSISIIGWHIYNHHITHKVFLACTIIGSTPSVLGHLLCPSQHSPLPCTWGIPLHRQSQADKNIMGSMIMSADLIIDTKMIEWYVFWVIIPIRIMQLSCEKGAWYMYHPPKHIILIVRKVCLWRSPGDRIVMFTGYVYLYRLIYWLISGLLYESASGLAWGPHYAYYFTFYLLIDTSWCFWEWV